jgi:hypothetical protein
MKGGGGRWKSNEAPQNSKGTTSLLAPATFSKVVECVIFSVKVQDKAMKFTFSL